MDPEKEGTIDEERKKLVIICATAAAAASTAVAEFATHYLTKQPYRDEAHRGQAETQRTKKRKTVADKITSPLKQMAAALERLAEANTDRVFAKEVTEAVTELPGYDMHQIIRATRYLLLHKMEAHAILSMPKEERAAYLEAFMHDASSG